MTGEAADSKFSTQISLHGIKNIFGEPTQMSLFDRDNVHYLQDAFLERLDQIKRVGSELTEIELRVLEAILKGFSRSGYKGNRPAIKREEILAAKSGGEYQPIFQYVKQIPVLRFRRADLLRWMGVNSTQFSTVSGVFLALSKLAHKQFYYYYERTAQDEEGNLIREGRGWKKEQVSCVGTLFNLEAVNDKDNFLYYDIRLNPIFLDQLNSYFLMIPEDWRREVKALVGKRKVSSYVFVFLMFLRYQYELRRRSPVAQHPYRLEKSPEDIAVGINIPPSIFKKKRKRMREILDECYEVATSLGYLRSFNRLGGIDVLVFDDQKYYNPKHILQDEPENPDDESRQRDSISLFKTFWDYQQSVDSGVIIPKGVIKSRQTRIFTEMLQARRKEDIERLIKWSVNAKFWCSRLSSPRMLQRNFHQAWMDMLGSRSNKEKNEDVLRGLQREQVKKGFDIICEFCSGSNGQTGARLEVFLIDSDEQQTKLSEHYFQTLSVNPESFEKELQGLLQITEQNRSLLIQQKKQKEEEKTRSAKFKAELQRAQNKFTPLLEYLRKRGHVAKWSINGDLVLNQKNSRTFANKPEFLDNIREFLKSQHILDNELEDLLDSLAQEPLYVG